MVVLLLIVQELRSECKSLRDSLWACPWAVPCLPLCLSTMLIRHLPGQMVGRAWYIMTHGMRYALRLLSDGTKGWPSLTVDSIK